MDIANPAFNRPPSVIQNEQEQELYAKLYPKAIGDFYHKDDVDIYIKQLNSELSALNSSINSLTIQLNTAFNTLATAINSAIASHGHVTIIPTPAGPVPTPTISAIPGTPVTPPRVTYSGNITNLKVDNIKANALIVTEKSGLDNVPQIKRKGAKAIIPPFSLDSI